MNSKEALNWLKHLMEVMPEEDHATIRRIAMHIDDPVDTSWLPECIKEAVIKMHRDKNTIAAVQVIRLWHADHKPTDETLIGIAATKNVLDRWVSIEDITEDWIDLSEFLGPEEQQVAEEPDDRYVPYDIEDDQSPIKVTVTKDQWNHLACRYGSVLGGINQLIRNDMQSQPQPDSNTVEVSFHISRRVWTYLHEAYGSPFAGFMSMVTDEMENNK